MATVCGTSLALMDAGVPLKRPTAGIAMGLILEDKRYAVLSDILGDEDHLGDMDFKVAGTEDGVTSLQMDIKIAGITEEIMKVALAQAKDGRLHILGEMAKALTAARAELGEYAPRIESFKIPADKIREVIGTGGKVIREIVEKTGAKINIEDDGTVKVASADGESIKAAINWIKSIASEPEVGHIYEGTVVKVMDFGAFVNFFGAKDGLVHISQLAPRRVQKTTDVVKEGDKVKVKLLGFDDRGKVRLSMKVVDQADRRRPRSQAKGRRRPAARGRSRRVARAYSNEKGGLVATFFIETAALSATAGHRPTTLALTPSPANAPVADAMNYENQQQRKHGQRRDHQQLVIVDIGDDLRLLVITASSAARPAAVSGSQKCATSRIFEAAIDRRDVRGNVGVIDLGVAGQQRVHHRNADARADIAQQAVEAGAFGPMRAAASTTSPRSAARTESRGRRPAPS